MCSPHNATQESTAGIEHIDGLYGYALVLTQNRTDAEDLVQETYVRAMGRLRNDSNVKGWLFTILATSGGTKCGKAESTAES